MKTNFGTGWLSPKSCEEGMRMWKIWVSSLNRKVSLRCMDHPRFHQFLLDESQSRTPHIHSNTCLYYKHLCERTFWIQNLALALALSYQKMSSRNTTWGATNPQPTETKEQNWTNGFVKKDGFAKQISMGNRWLSSQICLHRTAAVLRLSMSSLTSCSGNPCRAAEADGPRENSKNWGSERLRMLMMINNECLIGQS